VTNFCSDALIDAMGGRLILNDQRTRNIFLRFVDCPQIIGRVRGKLATNFHSSASHEYAAGGFVYWKLV